MDNFKDQIYGVLFGQAYADALGLCTEFMSVEQVRKRYPKTNIDISDKVLDDHRDTWKPYDWTDDTDHMILLARSIIQCKPYEKLSTVFERK